MQIDPSRADTALVAEPWLIQLQLASAGSVFGPSAPNALPPDAPPTAASTYAVVAIFVLLSLALCVVVVGDPARATDDLMAPLILGVPSSYVKLMSPTVALSRMPPTAS